MVLSLGSPLISYVLYKTHWISVAAQFGAVYNPPLVITSHSWQKFPKRTSKCQFVFSKFNHNACYFYILTQSTTMCEIAKNSSTWSWILKFLEPVLPGAGAASVGAFTGAAVATCIPSGLATAAAAGTIVTGTCAAASSVGSTAFAIGAGATAVAKGTGIAIAIGAGSSATAVGGVAISIAPYIFVAAGVGAFIGLIAYGIYRYWCYIKEKKDYYTYIIKCDIYL